MKSFLEERSDHLRDASENHMAYHLKVAERIERTVKAREAGQVLIFDEVEE